MPSTAPSQPRGHSDTVLVPPPRPPACRLRPSFTKCCDEIWVGPSIVPHLRHPRDLVKKDVDRICAALAQDFVTRSRSALRGAQEALAPIF
jgi:hypothetical protein